MNVQLPTDRGLTSVIVEKVTYYTRPQITGAAFTMTIGLSAIELKVTATIDHPWAVAELMRFATHFHDKRMLVTVEEWCNCDPPVEEVALVEPTPPAPMLVVDEFALPQPAPSAPPRTWRNLWKIRRPQ